MQQLLFILFVSVGGAFMLWLIKPERNARLVAWIRARGISQRVFVALFILAALAFIGLCFAVL